MIGVDAHMKHAAIIITSILLWISFGRAQQAKQNGTSDDRIEAVWTPTNP